MSYCLKTRVCSSQSNYAWQMILLQDVLPASRERCVATSRSVNDDNDHDSKASVRPRQIDFIHPKGEARKTGSRSASRKGRNFWPTDDQKGEYWITQRQRNLRFGLLMSFDAFLMSQEMTTLSIKNKRRYAAAWCNMQ
jgi:hypothetical protein